MRSGDLQRCCPLRSGKDIRCSVVIAGVNRLDNVLNGSFSTAAVERLQADLFPISLNVPAHVKQSVLTCIILIFAYFQVALSPSLGSSSRIIKFFKATQGRLNLRNKMKSTTLLNLAAIFNAASSCDSCYGPSSTVVHERLVRRIQPGSNTTLAEPRGPLEWGELNFLHTVSLICQLGLPHTYTRQG